MAYFAVAVSTQIILELTKGRPNIYYLLVVLQVHFALVALASAFSSWKPGMVNARPALVTALKFVFLVAVVSFVCTLVYNWLGNRVIYRRELYMSYPQWTPLYFVVSNTMHATAFQFYSCSMKEISPDSSMALLKTSSFLSRALLLNYWTMAVCVAVDWWYQGGYFMDNSTLVPWLVFFKLFQLQFARSKAKCAHTVRTIQAFDRMAKTTWFLAIVDNIASMLHSGPSTRTPTSDSVHSPFPYLNPGILFIFFSVFAFVLAAVHFEDVLVGFYRYDEKIIVGDIMRARCSQPFRYLADNPGKGIRHKFLKHLRRVFPVPDDYFAEVDRYMADLHHVSLLLDDIQDGSTMRRRRAASHVVFGVPQALNAACLHMTKANSRFFKFLDATGHHHLIHVINDEITRAFYGQGMDIWLRDRLNVSYEPPTIEEYKLMVSCKTTVIFRLGTLLLMSRSVPVSHFSSHRAGLMISAMVQNSKKCQLYKNILQIIEELGLLFQIRDDYRNLTLYKDEKGFCDDFSEGKWSYPVLVFLCLTDANAKCKQELLALLRSRPTDIATKKHMLSTLEGAGALEKSQRNIKELEDKVRARLKCLDIDLEGILHLLNGTKK